MVAKTKLVCQQCGVVHRKLCNKHMPTPEQSRRAVSYSKNWKARYLLDRELMRGRKQQAA